LSRHRTRQGPDADEAIEDIRRSAERLGVMIRKTLTDNAEAAVASASGRRESGVMRRAPGGKMRKIGRA
jgi:hypothetical protein